MTSGVAREGPSTGSESGSDGRRRSWPGADDGGSGGKVAGIGADRSQPPAVKAKVDRARPDDLAALPLKLLDEPSDEAQRVVGVTVFAHQEAAHIIARQGRLELAQLIAVKFVYDDAVFPAQAPGKIVFR